MIVLLRKNAECCVKAKIKVTIVLMCKSFTSLPALTVGQADFLYCDWGLEMVFLEKDEGHGGEGPRGSLT